MVETLTNEAEDALLPAGQAFVQRELRAAGLTVTALAEPLRISRKHVWDIVHGHVPISPHMAAALAAVLPVGVDEITALLHRARRAGNESPCDLRVAVHADLTEPSEDWEDA